MKPRSLSTGSLIGLVVLLSAASTQAVSQPVHAQRPLVSFVPGPARDRALFDVSAVSSNDIWGVGVDQRHQQSQDRTLTRHWNGAHWLFRAGPHRRSALAEMLWAVSALGPDDVWAVGSSSGGGPNRTLASHWDGHRWRVVPSPKSSESSYELFDVSARSSDDVWAVGDSFGQGGGKTLVAHWDGSRWRVLPSPSPGAKSNALQAVEAVAADDVWAAGWSYDDAGQYVLVEHWDGSSWSTVSTPRIGGTALTALTAVAADDIWAVGLRAESGRQHPLALHWDGTAWSVVAMSDGDFYNSVYSVSAVSADDVWTVGSMLDSSYSHARSLIEHWDGSRWAVVPSPNPGGDLGTYLRGVAAVSTSDVWAVGEYFNGVNSRTLREHWDGSVWTVR